MDGPTNFEPPPSITAARVGRLAGESAARLWHQVGAGAEQAVTTQSLDAALRDALASIRDLFQADASALLLASDTGDELVVRAASGLSEELAFAVGIRRGQGMTGRVLASRQPLIVADLHDIELATPILRDSGFRGAVAVPVVSEQQFLGVLYAASQERDRFSEEDVALLELVADRLGSALRRVQLFELERTARREAERLAERLARLQTITARLVASTTTTETVTMLGEAMASTALPGQVRNSSVWLVENGKLTLIRTPTTPRLAAAIGTVPLDSPLPLATAARERQPIFVASLTEGIARFPSLLETPLRADIGSFAVLPIVLNEECLGALVVAYPVRHEFDQGERDFLMAVVDQAAQALDRARLHSALEETAEVSAFFAQAAKAMAEASGFIQALERLASLALPAVGDICLIDVVNENGHLERVVATHRDPLRQYLVDRLQRLYPPEQSGYHPAAVAIRTGKTSWAPVMTNDFLRTTSREDAHFELIKELGFRSYVTVPLVVKSGVLGAVTFVSASRSFEPRDVAFTEQLAEQVAAVVDNARRYDATFRTSQILQENLLPQQLPIIPGLTIHTQYLAATRGLEVGGDFYDMLALPNGLVGFAVGDVVGHDRAAAALMGNLRSAARALTGQVDDPAALVEALRGSWALLGFTRLATALFGMLDTASAMVTLASAGHHPPLLVSGGRARYLPITPTTPLGAPATPVRSWTGRLSPGDVLLLYTDGVIDERGVGSDEGMAQLARAVSGEQDPRAVCERVVGLLQDDRSDDVALLALQYESVMEPVAGNG